jgi:hypothetical protein
MTPSTVLIAFLMALQHGPQQLAARCCDFSRLHFNAQFVPVDHER